ncbi:FAD-dependent pyridine nucleotide-disulfide oxidoreductase [Thermincola ferriacetica]|uniref:FAD-dependent pyridine nucleotide-disulfide oxidoreductase n=1 Tax=Thermincola ferriacetica TaxID=281456 RepID=A0A0L6W571_9FIRM|nr:FAD-dependent oxidoreductase [Thermincola ferriacetica]KNZ70244.1 FAD-dependent pyridine nucleotide-disulfide oxidoreductase [Thermincola ferriacetica]
MRHVIIGFSAAGLAAVRAIRAADDRAEITVITEEPHSVYSRCLLTYYLSGRVREDQMFLLTEAEVKALNITLKTGVRAVQVRPSVKEVLLSNGETVKFDKLLLATGASAIVPRATFEGAGQIYTLRTLDDAKTLEQNLPIIKKAVVLGDGLVAVTTAQALGQRGIDVSLVGLAPHLLAGFLDQKAGKLIEECLARKVGIKFYSGKTINKVAKDAADNINEVELSDGSRLQADAVILAVGVRPNIEPVMNTPIKCDRGIPVNDYMETNIPDIYAAGDVAQKRKILAGAAELVPLWPAAVEEGKTAGMNMAGRRKKYTGALTMNSVNVGGLSIIAAGLSNGAGQELKIYEYLNAAKPEYRRIVFRDDKLVGFILLGSTEKAGILSALVKEQVDVSTYKDEICMGRINYPKLSASKFAGAL